MENENYKRSDDKNAKKYERTITYDKICNICKEHFEAKAWNAKTCKKPECQAANAALAAVSREKRLKEGKQCSKLIDKEFICEKCNKSFIKHTTNRKKFRFCDTCLEEIKHELYINNKIQKYGFETNIVGSGGNQYGGNNPNWKNGISIENNYRGKFRGPNECYFCGRTSSVDIHHLDGNHNNNDKKNLIQLCRSCHKRLHYIYKRLEKLGIIFPSI